MKFWRLATLLAGLPSIFLGTATCYGQAEKTVPYPEWVKNAVIYEVNTRQHTPEGTFAALQKDLPRLKDLGVDILWLMPVNPIGEINRKGPLGSYYSVRDYTGINPEFGTAASFRFLVEAVHNLGMKVIIDWVPNHSAWDNPWVREHPDWYRKDSSGRMVSPFDWTDVVALDYGNAELRRAMIAAMKYWVDTFDIDGFRCDVAGFVPVDFWEQARPVLEHRKKLFMLAENEDVDKLCEQAFDMNYGWQMHHLMHRVAKGESGADTLLKAQAGIDRTFPAGAIKMNFITNHDENSWNGTVKEKFGDGWKAFAILTYTLPGMPLLYSGQEAGLDRRLKFFEKDPVDWTDRSAYPFYTRLNLLKEKEEALWNPPYGGILVRLKNSEPGKVVSFLREKGDSKVIVILNLSPVPVKVFVSGTSAAGGFTDVFTGDVFEPLKEAGILLPGWGYRLGLAE